MEVDDDRRRLRGDSPFPDVMNDPAYATNTDAKGKGLDEPDTCRICRGEGSEEEQLFYPCKCSGSIKFVHQACLMEWLSHSQKKYCELCKTPFRFTKLYDPDMPAELPAPVFIKELALHGLRTLVTWLRFLLVAFVWLGWLPWSMRAIWRALFWLADGRWPSSDSTQRPVAVPAESLIMQLAANGTTPVNHTLASNNPSVSTAAQAVASALPQVLSPVSSMLNFSSSEPVVFTLAKRAFLSLFVPAVASGPGTTNSSQFNTTISPRQRQPSWLSNVSFLNSLTSSPTLNNIVIDTLEGQLITLLVVVSFILVFLIREWVVQQQPAVNLGEEERDAVVQLIAENRNRVNRQEEAPANGQEAPLRPHDEHPTGTQPEPEAEVDIPRHDSQGSPAETAIPSSSAPETTPAYAVDAGPLHPRPGQSTSRPTLQSRNALDDASNIRRTIEETASGSGNQAWPGLETFKDLWIRGEGNPEQVLRIIQEEGRQEELGWVVSAMTRLQRANSAQNILRNDRREDQLFNPDVASEGPSWRPLTFDGPTWTESRHEDGEVSAMSGALTADDDIMATSDGPSRTSSPLERFNDDVGFQAPNISSESPEHAEERVGALQPASADEGQNPEPGNVGPEDIARQGQTDGPSDNTRVNSAEPAAPVPQNLVDQIFDWLWGDIAPRQGAEDAGQDDEHIIEDPALEAPFVRVQNRQNVAGGGRAGNQWQDPVAAPAADGEANDVDAVEEADDFEGILELIGMQGPIFGLLQNGVFSALLISLTVAVGIWLPYLWGKIALVFLTNPIQLFVGVPLALLSITADVAVDTLIGSVGYIIYWVSIVLRFLLRPVDGFLPFLDWIPKHASVTNTSLSLIDGSSQRLRRVIDSFFNFHESDLPMFSVLSHQALRLHEARIASLFRLLFGIGKFILHDFPLRLLSQGIRQTLFLTVSHIDLVALFAKLRQSLKMLNRSTLFSLGSLDWVNSKVVISIPDQVPSDYDLARWDTKDRIIAIIIGYIFASLLGLLYLKITGLISGVNRGQRIEGVVADVLHQAGGVMKVILIIGIEMIVFPLYCGILLDLALMPLFENATLASRIDFTMSSPLTSLFVHWFVGTCYMFHFALFVSMCRKIMRSGVLYFIRDPDDPTFHPVRDVLERNIMTQLRKIAFSALVYGALVIICLGGVVWGLSFAFEGVLPIHWSSNIPVLEFPVDLLFYNFVMPFAIRSLKPSDGLHAMYNWWFHKCARLLRLSEFLFGERHRDEEGRHVRRTWRDFFSGKKGDPEHPVVGEEQRMIAEKEGRDVYFLRDGRYVRAPASDQVRIPKGSKVFLEVTEDNKRVDGAPDPDDGLHGRTSDMFTKVYIPPFFRLRIAAFIFLIWVFAAVTGVSVTVVPLVMGRRMISSFFPSPIRVNDIYAFSAGIYTLGGAAYALFYCRTGYSMLKERLRPVFASPRQAISGTWKAALQAIRLIYVSSAFVLFIPSLFALLTELYVLVPLHTYVEDQKPHVIHFIQDWTLGVLYVQMALKFIQWRSTSRPALALNAIVRDGWLRPNAGLATRAFILPVSVLALCAVILPLCVGFIVNTVLFHNATGVIHSKVYRYSYPASFMAGLLVWFVFLLRRQVEVWRAHIRDDVYLIGERLHNFGEKRARDVGVPRRMMTS
ncbi:hypothetical protein VTN77DRAFT_6161 [Rasamsonia byssochlamydoides]|uniref:uncharacterized protein n=1 Tax=Rasamsonia byssochlamydoides TaxID=89139 RepID=UPI003742B420